MIYGIGVDTTTISRIEKSMQSEVFLQRFFSESELAMFRAKNMRAQTVAANFAAKEAIGKALGTGLSGFVWAEISVLRGEQGAPYVQLSGAAAELFAQKGLRPLISLTHEGDFATAFAVLETIGG